MAKATQRKRSNASRPAKARTASSAPRKVSRAKGKAAAKPARPRTAVKVKAKVAVRPATTASKGRIAQVKAVGVPAGRRRERPAVVEVVREDFSPAVKPALALPVQLATHSPIRPASVRTSGWAARALARRGAPEGGSGA